MQAVNAVVKLATTPRKTSDASNLASIKCV
jgi:hypothetical protein